MNSKNRLWIALTVLILFWASAPFGAAQAAASEETNMSETKIANDDWQERGEREIHELHQFFEDWFNGALPDEDAAFARFADVMSDSFTIVSPSGRLGELSALLGNLRGAHGKAEGGKIWIEDIRLLHREGSTMLFSYIEWQNLGQVRGRQSTVAFQVLDGEEAEGSPNGLRWLHVHETWLPADARPKNVPESE